MNTNTRIESTLTTRRPHADWTARPHRLPMCAATQLARYRDRHQARHGAQALTAGSHNYRVSTFACPDCRGFHLEKIKAPAPTRQLQPTVAFTSSPKRCYVLFDVENLTHGAKATCEELGALWSTLTQQAPGITSHDHVVVGAARHVARKYRGVIYGPNVKWVVGADRPDGADHALLAAIDLHRVARHYDELVIISGDHAFTDIARRAKAFGLSVRIVTAEHPEHRSMLSRKLSQVADALTLVQLKPCTQGRDHSTPVTNLATQTRHQPIQVAAARAA